MIEWLKREIKAFLCDHTNCNFVRDIGGDEQMHHYVKGGNLAKSEHKCNDCGEMIYKSYRVKE